MTVPNIFTPAPQAAPQAPQHFADDVVGRFRSGYQVDGRPVALTQWRVTTGDPVVAATIQAGMCGQAPREWETSREDRLEVLTATSEIEIVVESASDLRLRMQLWGRDGKLAIDSDGETLADGTPDPDAFLKPWERKQKARNGIGPSPAISLRFRIAGALQLGRFEFRSGSWSMLSDLERDATASALARVGGAARCLLRLEQVEFVAKNGPSAGQTIRYTKPVLKVLGPVAELVA